MEIDVDNYCRYCGRIIEKGFYCKSCEIMLDKIKEEDDRRRNRVK